MNTNQLQRNQAATGVNRRHFLRGLGACIALPAFASLEPVSLFARGTAPKLATTATGAPLRTAFLSFPNGAIPSAWWPEKEGSNIALSKTLEPLESHRDMIQIMGGLDHLNAESHGDGGGDHARGNGVFLTGVRLKKSSTEIHAGVSIDQVMAREVGGLTRLPSLELTCDKVHKSGICDSNYSCAYVYNISWSSPTTPMTPEANPRIVFERLFGQGAPGERTANVKRLQAQQRSILDFVMDDARRVQRKMDARDKEKLDQYMTGVRSIETRIQKAEELGIPKDPNMETPAGIPLEYGDHLQIMFDMLVLAFQTDSTRVASFCLAHDGDNRSFSDIGIPEGHHDLSHHQNKEDRIKKVAEIDLWYVKQFARFLQKMRDTKDVDGNSLLHNSMIVYGGGNADGNMHTHRNLPVILAGGGGGTFNTNLYKNYRAKPMCNLYLSMADRMGMRNLERFGDSTGRLSV